MAATGTMRRSFGSLAFSISKRAFSTSPSPVDANGLKSMNLFSAINHALQIALESDPRSFPTSPFLFRFCFCLLILVSLHKSLNFDNLFFFSSLRN